MRQFATSILLFAVACASPRTVAPTTATVFIAPVVCSSYVKDGLPRDLVAEFDRRLRLAINMKQVGAEDDADFVLQAVVSFASVEITESKLYVIRPSFYWEETLVATVTLTAKTETTKPTVVTVEGAAGTGYLTKVNPSFVQIFQSLKGCTVDAASGNVLTPEGNLAWMRGLAHVQGLDEGGAWSLLESLGLPLNPLPPIEIEFQRQNPGWETMRNLINVLTTSQRIHGSGPGNHQFYWDRTRPVLVALIAREQLKGEKLDVADLRLLSSLFDHIAHQVSNDGPWEDRWGIESYAELCEWLVARMRDDYDAFRSGYKTLLAKNIEPEFCKAVYKRWPPDPEVFGNAYTR